MTAQPDRRPETAARTHTGSGKICSLSPRNVSKPHKLNQQISEEKFRAGTINSFNYRDVQLIYLNASIDRLQAIYDLIDTDTELTRITGGIITEY